jgi:hypothetical protein
MGGIGSGRSGSRANIEDGLKLDLRRLRQKGLLNDGVSYGSGSLIWSTSAGEQVASIGYSYCTDGDKPWFKVSYTSTNASGTSRKVEDTFELERFTQPFGGHRWYLRCPTTGRRVQCLYKPPDAVHFRGRGAYRLAYRTQNLEPSTRVRRRARGVADGMRSAGPREWRAKYADWDFPPKPPWMRWATYTRKFELWEELKDRGDALACAEVSGVLRRLNSRFAR